MELHILSAIEDIVHFAIAIGPSLQTADRGARRRSTASRNRRARSRRSRYLVVGGAVPALADHLHRSRGDLGGEGADGRATCRCPTRRWALVFSAFALGYAAAQMPGRLVRRSHRSTTRAGALVVLWSVLTALTGVDDSSRIRCCSCAVAVRRRRSGRVSRRRARLLQLAARRRARHRQRHPVLRRTARRGASRFPIYAWLLEHYDWRGAFYILGMPGVSGRWLAHVVPRSAARTVGNVHDARGADEPGRSGRCCARARMLAGDVPVLRRQLHVLHLHLVDASLSDRAVRPEPERGRAVCDGAAALRCGRELGRRTSGGCAVQVAVSRHGRAASLASPASCWRRPACSGSRLPATRRARSPGSRSRPSASR